MLDPFFSNLTVDALDHPVQPPSSVNIENNFEAVTSSTDTVPQHLQLNLPLNSTFPSPPFLPPPPHSTPWSSGSDLAPGFLPVEDLPSNPPPPYVEYVSSPLSDGSTANANVNPSAATKDPPSGVPIVIAENLSECIFTSNKLLAGKISVALGGLFSATAGPLLPDNIAFKSFNKMWKTSSSEDLTSLDVKGILPPPAPNGASDEAPARFRIFRNSNGASLRNAAPSASRSDSREPKSLQEAPQNRGR